MLFEKETAEIDHAHCQRCVARASRAGAALRRQSWLQWRSQRHAVLPVDRLWIIADLCIRLCEGSNRFDQS